MMGRDGVMNGRTVYLVQFMIQDPTIHNLEFCNSSTEYSRESPRTPGELLDFLNWGANVKKFLRPPNNQTNFLKDPN